MRLPLTLAVLLVLGVSARTARAEPLHDTRPWMSWEDRLRCELVVSGTYAGHGDDWLELRVSEFLRGGGKARGSTVRLALEHWYRVEEHDGRHHLRYESPGHGRFQGYPAVVRMDPLEGGVLCFLPDAARPTLASYGQALPARDTAQWRRVLEGRPVALGFRLLNPWHRRGQEDALEELARDLDEAVVRELFEAAATGSRRTAWAARGIVQRIGRVHASVYDLVRERWGSVGGAALLAGIDRERAYRALRPLAAQEGADGLRALEALGWVRTPAAVATLARRLREPASAGAALTGLERSFTYGGTSLAHPWRETLRRMAPTARPLVRGALADPALPAPLRDRMQRMPAFQAFRSEPAETASRSALARAAYERPRRHDVESALSRQARIQPRAVLDALERAGYVDPDGRWECAADVVAERIRIALGRPRTHVEVTDVMRAWRGIPTPPAVAAQARRSLARTLFRENLALGLYARFLQALFTLVPEEAPHVARQIVEARPWRRGARRHAMLAVLVAHGHPELVEALLAQVHEELERVGEREALGPLRALWRSGHPKARAEARRIAERASPYATAFAGQFFKPRWLLRLEQDVWREEPGPFLMHVAALLDSDEPSDRGAALRALEETLQWYDPFDPLAFAAGRKAALERLRPVFAAMATADEWGMRRLLLAHEGVVLDGEASRAWLPVLIAAADHPREAVAANALRLVEHVVERPGAQNLLAMPLGDAAATVRAWLADGDAAASDDE